MNGMSLLEHGKIRGWQSINEDSAIHLVPAFVVAVELESTLIDNGVGGRDDWKREDNFPLRNRAVRLFLDGLSFDMFKLRERRCNVVVAVTKLAFPWCRVLLCLT